MQTKSHILFLFSILILVLSSCVKDPGEFESRLNIISLISPGEGFTVVVTKTAPALGNHENLEVGNALVTIEKNETGEKSKLIYQGDGIYTSVVKPTSGDDYEIQVIAPGFETAAATTYVPDLNDVAIYMPEGQDENSEISLSFSANFNASSSFFAYELMYSEEENPDLFVPLSTYDGNVSNQVGNEDKFGISNLLPISGEVSDGSTMTLSSLKTTTTKGEPVNINNVSIRLVSVSPQYHAYLMEENDIENAHYSSSYYQEDGIFTNFVGNAYGIFGGFNERTIKLVN